VDNVAPVRRGTRLRFEAGQVVLEIDAACGGRIVEYSLDERNVLFDCDDEDKRGSTFWTSPQAAWSWPPPPEIDRDPYTVRRIDPAGVSLTSRPSAVLGVSVEKSFAMASNGSVTIDYRIEDAATDVRAVAPWEVTRVPRSGVSFFPRGASVHRSPRFPAPSCSESEGLVWLEHASHGGIDRKLHAEGPGGWLAHADAGLLFVKTFENVPPEAQATDESMVEIFVSGGAPYVELEAQGACQRLKPGTSLTWRVVWQLTRLQDHQRASRSELATAAKRLAR
jgi:hypothetical protein